SLTALSSSDTLRSIRRHWPSMPGFDWVRILRTDSRHAVLLEPLQQPLPPVLGLVFPVAGTVVGVEAVRRVGVEHDLARLLRLGPLVRDAGRGPAVKAPPRRVEILDHIDRVLGLQLIRGAHEPAVPRHAGLEVLAVRRVQPDDPAAPAEAGDAEFGRVALT